MHVYDIAIVGAGAAGSMAAIRVAALGKKVLLIERNLSVGKKLLLTGKTRCNLTNVAGIGTFIEAFGKQGKFLRSAFQSFFNNDLMDFFKRNGLGLKVERQGRVFPVTDKAVSIVNVLKKCLSKKEIKLLYDMRVVSISRKKGLFELKALKGHKVYAKKVILSTGGASYKVTGSSGDGYCIARELGHTVEALRPALVPLKIKEQWVKELKGLSLKNIRLTFKYDTKKIISSIGEMIFTHFGVSGPLVLDLSGKITPLFASRKSIDLLIDLKPGLTREQLEKRLLREFESGKSTQLKNIMKNLLPNKLIPAFLHIADVMPEKQASQLSRKERHSLVELLKALPLTVTGSLAIEAGMVTNGGVSLKEINPRTMESRIVEGLYFAGELIDGSAPSGGYNLQQAFSTGFLAGESAAHA